MDKSVWDKIKELDDGTFHRWMGNIGCLQRTIGEGKRWKAGTRWHQTPGQVSQLELPPLELSPANRVTSKSGTVVFAQ